MNLKAQLGLEKNFQRVFITGAAGFIGSTLIDRLLDEKVEVVGFDNFSTGQRRFLEPALESKPSPVRGAFRLIEGDCLDQAALTQAMAGCDLVVHFSANADVRFGTEHPGRDLEQNTLATFRVLEGMRANGIKRIVFSSTGSIYGEAKVIPTPEDAPFPIQTSLYGASKLAGESLIQAYCEGFGFEGYIFRFVSILGERYTHGHVFDFYKQLLEHPDHLKVLGDGTQRKSYLYVQDCIDAIFHVIGNQLAKNNHHRSAIFNLGASEYCELNDSIRWICGTLGIQPKIEYTGGSQGWIGDNPFIFLDTQKIRSTGWKTTLSIQEGIVRTLLWLKENPWVYASRK